MCPSSGGDMKFFEDKKGDDDDDEMSDNLKATARFMQHPVDENDY